MKNSIFFVFTLICAVSNAQKTSFDIVIMDKKVGEANLVKKVISEGKYSLAYTFDATVMLLFIKTVVDMDINVSFDKSQLTNAKVVYKYNDKLLNRSIVWDGAKYNVDSNGKKTTITKKAFFTVMNLYEKEPIGIKEVFLEKQSEFVALKSLGNNQYSLIVDGDNCIYTYKNGALQKIVIDAFANVTLLRK